MAILDFFKRNKQQQTSSLQNFSSNLFNNPISTPSRQTKPALPTFQKNVSSRPVNMSSLNRSVAPTTPTPTFQADTTPTSISELVRQPSIPTAPTGTPASDNLARFSSSTIAGGAERETQRVTDRESAMNRLADLLEKQGERAGRQEEISQEIGFEETQRAYTEALAQEAQIDRQYERQLRDLREGAVGQSEGAIQAQERELRRKRSQEVADLAIISAARQGDVTTAQNIIQQKLDAEFEPVQQQIDTLKTFLTLNQDDLTESEKILLQSQIDSQESVAESEREYANLVSGAQAYQTMLDEGTISPDKVPEEYLRFLNVQGYASPEQRTSASQTEKRLNNLFEVLGNESALKGSVGITQLGRITNQFTGTRTKIRGLIESVISGETLEELQKMKGVPSDRDIEVVRAATGVLAREGALDQLSDEKIIAELKKIENAYINSLLENPATDRFTKEQILETKYIREFPDADPAQIDEMVQQTLSTTEPASKNTSLNRPQRNNNPGNVKAGGVADDLAIGTDEQGHLIFPNEQAGFLGMQRDLRAKITGNSRFLPVNPTIAQLGKVYAEDQNWANSVAKILNVSPSTKTASIPFEQLIEAVATQEGFYA